MTCNVIQIFVGENMHKGTEYERKNEHNANIP